ncbi:MAG: hypothetical protein AAGC99_12425 [Pseudomonadota bacterium]
MTQPIDARTYDQIDGSFPSITIDQLSIGEQLVIWAMRHRLAEGSESTLVRGFHVAFGLSAVEPAIAAFNGLFKTLFYHCKRDLGFHATRCRCVSSDEILIVSIIAANHAGMAAHAREIGCSLVFGKCVEDLLGHAATLSLLMQRQNLRLPLRPLVSYGEERPALLH